MITYVKISDTLIEVRIDGKKVGAIKTVLEGFQYFSKGSRTGGAVFTNLSGCKASLNAMYEV